MFEPEALMRLAIEKAKQGIAAGQSPFGCAIARGDELLAATHNTVLASIDITAHAEVNALRVACPRAGDIFLAGCVAASTCEPCPMCMSALHWSQIDTVYYGAAIADAKAAGFNEMQIPAAEIARLGGLKVRLVEGLLAKECRALFDEWQASPRARRY
jgi:tRNA(Arg) A34 adenosine deaminase TadA